MEKHQDRFKSWKHLQNASSEVDQFEKTIYIWKRFQGSSQESRMRFNNIRHRFVWICSTFFRGHSTWIRLPNALFQSQSLFPALSLDPSMVSLVVLQHSIIAFLSPIKLSICHINKRAVRNLTFGGLSTHRLFIFLSRRSFHLLLREEVDWQPLCWCCLSHVLHAQSPDALWTFIYRTIHSQLFLLSYTVDAFLPLEI